MLTGAASPVQGWEGEEKMESPRGAVEGGGGAVESSGDRLVGWGGGEDGQRAHAAPKGDFATLLIALCFFSLQVFRDLKLSAIGKREEES